MASNLCEEIVKGCPCDDWPFLNFSEEKPEVPICYGIRHFEIYPSLNRNWQASDCVAYCITEGVADCHISAQYCALIDALNCAKCGDAPCTPTCAFIFGFNFNGQTAQPLLPDTKRFVKFQVPADLTYINSISFELNRTGPGTGYAVNVGIYTDNAGSPDALVANSEIPLTTDVKIAAPMWYNAIYTGIKPVLTPGADYWFGIITELAIETFFSPGTANQQASRSDTFFGGLSDPFGTPSFEASKMAAAMCYKSGYYNTRQCADQLICNDGSVTAPFCVEAGTIPGSNQKEADDKALSIAQSQTRLRQICLSDIVPVCCLSQYYNQTIIATGESVAAPAANLWQIISGTLPPGLVFNGGQIQGPASITGFATTAGPYTFEIRITAPNGVEKTKSYTINVMGILTLTPLPGATPNVAYTITLSSAGFSPTFWTVISGSMPSGFSLNSVTGEISGTTADVGDFTFTVQASDATNACAKTFQLACFAYSGIRVNAWKAYCGFESLLNTFSVLDCTLPPTPTPPSTCPPLGTLTCDERWLFSSVRSRWNNSYFSIPGSPEEGGNAGPNTTSASVTAADGTTVKAVVDDTTTSSYNRYNCPGSPEIHSTYAGQWIGDPYEIANNLGTILTSDPTKPFIWDVQFLQNDHFLVYIDFWLDNGVTHFFGSQEYELDVKYTFQDLQDDLIKLWNNVDTDNYPWIDGFVDVFVTYDNAENGYKPIQYSPEYPDLALPVTNTSGGSSVRAEAYCHLQNRPVVPPLQTGDTEYHAGWLIDPTCTTQEFPCVNLIKTLFRYGGLLCQTDFTRPLPYGIPATCPDAPFGPTCDKPWDPGTTTHLLPTTLVPFWVYPIAATPAFLATAPPNEPLTYQPGIRKISQNCSLIDWWKMEEIGSADRIGAKSLIHLVPVPFAGNTVNDTLGIISNGIEFASIGNGTDFLESADLPALRYSGDAYVNGMEITGWFKLDVSVTPSTDAFFFRLVNSIPGWTLEFVIGANLTATASDFVNGGIATTPFNGGLGPVVTQWYFFRVWYDAINVQVGFELNNDGNIFFNNVTGPLVTSPDNKFQIAFTGTAFNNTTIVFDEVAVWNAHLSPNVAAFLYNNGSGVTYPFA